jgi:alpha-1,3-mannosyltransferase
VTDAVDLVREPDDNALARLLSKASYFVSLSAYEGFGVAVVEAMSAGLVPNLSRIPPFERFVQEASAGILVDPDDVDATAAEIAALSSRVERAEGAERSKVMNGARRYAWSGVHDAYLAQYEASLRRDAP